MYDNNMDLLKNFDDNDVDTPTTETPDLDEASIASNDETEQSNEQEVGFLATRSLLSSQSEDPTHFQDAPYSYNMSQVETATLNSGTLQYTVTDFSLPGRNGFDFVMTRRYNSDNAGLYAMNPVYDAPNEFHTSSRNNVHNNKMYGLGFGWYFVLPSIEVVPENEQDQEHFTYSPFLHLEDGRNFEMNGNTLKGHTLLDVTVEQTTGSIQHPYRSDVTKQYDIIVSYKNGNKDYFQKIYDGNNKLDCIKLVVRQDRFLNTICYSLAGNSGMTVVDTWGRSIVLSASGNVMTWTMPDSTTEDPRKISYTMSDTGGRRLTQAKDQKNRITQYEYHSTDTYKAVCKYASTEYGDTSNVAFPFLLLKKITHPTGALTQYEYGVSSNNTIAPLNLEINEIGGYRKYFPLRSRKDTSEGVDYHTVGYT